MNSLRLWVLVLAVVSFAAGLATGVWGTAARLKPLAKAGPFDDYKVLLLREFPLSPEREGHLDTILAAYDRDIQAIEDRHMADTMSSMEQELEERGRYYRGLIQDRVLPENQRERFARMALGGPSNPH